ncbi:Ppx/GppA phosphatase family protein [Limisalsivibrio acetivorans]|uniref:Ppx/GppA phosphatase family protein n=1 Tax=Limisalsivibrio acetivorans TaxID=1304888 RepID=UPI0003B46BEB|nr:Ppx/GppA phosphatase family protein [Limisalsivibrio acetivorans]
MRTATIDIGSNAVRLLIADVEDGKITNYLQHGRHITRLGDKMGQTGKLSEESVVRTLKALQEFGSTIIEYDCKKLKTVATSAVREAENPELLIDAAKEMGFDIEVIDGHTEASLIYKGAVSGIETEHQNTLLFDIGGGSTEFIYAKAGEKPAALSVPLGVVKLADLYDFSGPCIEEHMDKMKIPIYNVISEVNKHMNCEPEILIASAGTPTTLAAIDLEMEEYDWKQVNGHVLTREAIGSIFERLSTVSGEERLKIKGMEEGREDLIIPGTLITMEMMDMFGMERLTVSDFGLREGLAIAVSEL